MQAPAVPIVQPAPVPPPPSHHDRLHPRLPNHTNHRKPNQTGLRSKPGSPGLAGISKILRRPTPSKSISNDSETSPCQTPTTAGGGGGAQQQHERSSSGGCGVTPAVEKRRKFRRSWFSQTPSTPQQTQGGNRKKRGDYNFSTKNDIQGIVVLEILGATQLPKLKNGTSPSTLTPHKSK
jgi:hypothetical protein